MTLSFKIKLLLALKKFMALMSQAWAQYMGRSVDHVPDEGNDLEERNKREHGSTSSPKKGNVRSKYGEKK